MRRRNETKDWSFCERTTNSLIGWLHRWNLFVLKKGTQIASKTYASHYFQSLSLSLYIYTVYFLFLNNPITQIFPQDIIVASDFQITRWWVGETAGWSRCVGAGRCSLGDEPATTAQVQTLPGTLCKKGMGWWRVMGVMDGDGVGCDKLQWLVKEFESFYWFYCLCFNSFGVFKAIKERLSTS